MTQFKFNQLIALHKRIRDLKALQASPIKATLWADWNRTGVGAVKDCEQFIPERMVRTLLAKEIKALKKKVSSIVSKFPVTVRPKVRENSYNIAMQEKF